MSVEGEPRSFEPVTENRRRTRSGGAVSNAVLNVKISALEDRVNDLADCVRDLSKAQNDLMKLLNRWMGAIIGAGAAMGLFGEEMGKWLLNLIG